MSTTATASDDGYVNIQNHQNQKQEGALCPFTEGRLPEVKICKFLKGHNCLVSADMDGYLNFYAVVPSPFKNQLLCRKIFHNEREQIRDGDNNVIAGQDSVSFPIRGMDFNPQTNILYTGDEAGYLQKWDLEDMLTKLKTNETIFKAQQERDRQGGAAKIAATTESADSNQSASQQQS